MAGLPLKQGTVLDFHNHRYTCGGRGPGGGYLLIPLRGRNNRVLKPEAAFDALEKQQLKIVQEEAEYEGEPLPSCYADLTAVSEKERDLVLMRHFYLQRLQTYRADGGTLSDIALEDFARRTHTDYVTDCRTKGRSALKSPMSASAIRRWHRKWSESGFRLTSLVHDTKGNSHSKLALEQEDALYAAIHNEYMDNRRISANHVHTLMAAKLDIENRNRATRGLKPIPIPHYSTLLKHIQRIDLYDRLKARYNAAYATKVTRSYGITPPTTRHLERVQVDHTLLDIYVDFGGKVLVRPWLTLILDSYSKAIMGFWLTPEPASAQSVMQALRMAVLPKNMRELGGDNDWHWPMHGMPAELTLDNGKEFHGLDLEMAAAELNITLNFTPPRQPWHKSQVERKFGEINRSLLAQMPGQVFKYEPEKHGNDYPHLTLEEFKCIFLQWVTTVLHRKPNKEGYTPEELWMESVHKHGTPGAGLSAEYIFMCLSKTVVEKIVHPDGIHFNNLNFNNEWLSRLRNELSPQAGDRKPTVKIKWSASDVGVIYVLHPKMNQYFEVHAKEEHAQGRSLYNHRVVLREQRNRRRARMRDSSYLDAVLAVNQHIKSVASTKAVKVKKLGTRLTRFEGGKPEQPGQPRTAPPTPPGPFDRDEQVLELPADIIDMDTGEVIATEPALKKTNHQDDDIEDFSKDLEI